MDDNFYKLSIDDVLKALGSAKEGLSLNEVKRRQERQGLNKLKEEKGTSMWSLFLSQLANPLVIILCFATGLKFFLGSYVEGATIGATVFLMISLAFIQEARAEHSLQALKNLAPLKCRVLRENIVSEILSEELVPGDILVLESGDKISADARVLSVSHFQVSEASLTGESTPISKVIDPLKEDLVLADQKNMIFSSSIVLTGRAHAVVTATGMKTQLGQIAEQMGKIKKEKTPLQKGIDQLSRGMLIFVAVSTALLIIIGLITSLSWIDIILFAVAIAVAAIPEGLPAVVTVVLSIGVRLMAKKNALVRKLLAVETLGSTSVICSDKTGTLTLNQLTVTDYERTGDESHLLEIAVLCQDAYKENQEWKGDPVDIALIKWCIEKGCDIVKMRQEHQRLSDLPFTSENGLMATLNKFPDGTKLLVKGALEKVVEACKFEKEKKQEFVQRASEMSRQGLKVIAAAWKPFKSSSFDLKDAQNDLEFCGFFGLIDPPREDVALAIAKCRKAGIHVAMITGDHLLTGQAIGSQIGFDKESAITGSDIVQLTEEDLQKKVEKTAIFARIEPLQKLDLVRAYKKLGHIVAMTGDGVNDSPALEAADIGISMGKQGTDVAKEASEIVLLDDRFATIVDAIEEGRVLFSRLRHAVTFLLATCFGEVFVILLSFFTIGFSPLEPLQILWINLITGSLLAVPLGTEPKVGDELNNPPRDPAVGIIYPGMMCRIVFFALCLGLGSYLTFLLENPNDSLFRARSVVFTTIILFEWLIAFQVRSDEKPLIQLGLLKNKNLLFALSVAFVLFLVILYVPAFQTVFHLKGLNLYEWGMCALPGFILFLLEEVRKFFFPKLFSFGKWRKSSF